MVNKERKKLYEKARREALIEIGKSKISDLTEVEREEFNDKINRKFNSYNFPNTAAKNTEEITAAIAKSENEEEIMAPATAAAVKEAEKTFKNESVDIRNKILVVDNFPSISKSKILTDSGREPLIDKLNFIDLFYFTVYKGYAGVGKTSSIESYGFGNDYDIYEFVCSEDMNTFDLVGSFIIQGGNVVFNESAITSAVKNSISHKTLLILDEINLLRPATLKSLNDLFDYRKSVDTVIGRFNGNNLKIVGLMNLETESIGNDLDVSVQSRAFVHNVDETYVIKKLIKNGMPQQIGELMKSTNFAFGLREWEQLQILITNNISGSVDLLLQKYGDELKQDQIRQAFIVIFGSEYNDEVNKLMVA